VAEKFVEWQECPLHRSVRSSYRVNEAKRCGCKEQADQNARLRLLKFWQAGEFRGIPLPRYGASRSGVKQPPATCRTALPG
jgi:hypothetical protein